MNAINEPEQTAAEPSPDGAKPLRDRGALAWLIPACAFALMLALTWRTWPDPAVDFGQVVYPAWQYSEGTQTYSDVVTLRGPFSNYVNALWFTLFGPGIMTIAVANIILTGITAALIGWVCSSLTSRWGGIAAATTFVLVFACADHSILSSYNFIAPYVQDVTHGLLLGLAALGFAIRYSRRFDVTSAVLAGLFAGFAALTKAEVTLATVGAVGAAAFATWWQQRDARRITSHAGAMVAAFFVPSLLLACVMFVIDRDSIVRGLLGEWPYIIEGNAADLPLYRWLMGTNDPARNLTLLIQATLLYAAGAGAWLVIARQAACAKQVWVGPLVAIIVTFFSVYVLYQWLGVRLLLHAGRPLPLLMIVIACFALRNIWMRQDARAAGVLAACVFSLGMLSKIILNARMTDYGFALAVPATSLAVAAGVAWLPAWAERFKGDGRTVAAGAAVVVIMLASGFAYVSAMRAAAKTHIVGEGRDMFYTDARGPVIEEARLELQRHTSENNTLLSLPDALLLNYLARRRTASAYVNFDPVGIAIFGEARMLESLKVDPPDYVVIADRDTSDTGPRFFGQDYGVEIANWLKRNYAARGVIGAMPATGRGYGVLLLQRTSERANDAADAGPQREQDTSKDASEDAPTPPG